MFRDLIKNLQQNSENDALSVTRDSITYTVFKIKNSRGKIAYYVYSKPAQSLEEGNKKEEINKENLLGIGGNGRVYKAFSINPFTGEKNTDTFFAVKESIITAVRGDKIEDSVFAEEVNNMAPYYQCAAPIQNQHGQYLLLMEAIPGKSLHDHFEACDRPFPNLNFHGRIQLCCQLSHWLNLFHHETPTTGKAIAHLDLKENNIHCFFNQNTQQHELYLLDFGGAIQLQTEDAMENVALDRGTWYIISPEQTQNVARGQTKPEQYLGINKKNTGIAGAASDIYALAYFFMRIFGAERAQEYLTAPGIFYHDQLNAYKKNARTSYKMEHFLKQIDDIPNILFADKRFDLGQILTDFVKRMSNLDYRLRPTTDEVLHFFTTINLLCTLEEKYSATNNLPHYEETKTAYLAKLCILNANLWYKNIGKKQADQYITYQQQTIKIAIENLDKTFADFDFQFQYERNKQIINEHLTQTLQENSQVITEIKQSEQQAFQALSSDQKHSAKESLSSLLQLPRHLLKKHLHEQHQDLLLKQVTTGIKHYQTRAGSHLSIWSLWFDSERGKIRAQHYINILENTQYSFFTKMVVIFALLMSRDGKTLQQDILQSFKTLFKTDMTLDTLQSGIANILAVTSPIDMHFTEIEEHVKSIVKAMNNMQMPDRQILANLNQNHNQSSPTQRSH